MPEPLSQRAIAHCLWMAELDQSYALKAAKWYSQVLEDASILTQVQGRLEELQRSLSSERKPFK